MKTKETTEALGTAAVTRWRRRSAADVTRRRHSGEQGRRRLEWRCRRRRGGDCRATTAASGRDGDAMADGDRGQRTRSGGSEDDTTATRDEAETRRRGDDSGSDFEGRALSRTLSGEEGFLRLLQVNCRSIINKEMSFGI